MLITLIIGLAIAFERILSLNRADINAPKFMARVKEALDSGPQGMLDMTEYCNAVGAHPPTLASGTHRSTLQRG